MNRRKVNRKRKDWGELASIIFRSPAPTIIIGLFGSIIFLLTGNVSLGFQFVLTGAILGIAGIFL